MNNAVRLSAIALTLSVCLRSAFPQSAIPGNTVIANPASVTLCGQPGQAISGVPITLSSPAGPTTALSMAVTSDGNWLMDEPTYATLTERPSEMLIGLNTPLIPLGVGTYYGQIVLSGLDGSRLATIPVTLQVSGAGCGATRSGSLLSNTGALTFQLPAGASSGQVLSIFNTYATGVAILPLVHTSSGQSWLDTVRTNLFVVPGFLYPTPLTVNVNTAGLGFGASYTGAVELESSNAAILTIPVTLNVASAGSPRFAVTPSPLSIGVVKGTPSTSVNIQLTNLSASAVGISTTATSSRNWLSVTPASGTLQGNEATTLIASIAAAGLVDGPNTGSITVKPAGPGDALVIPVTVTYGIDSDYSVDPNPLTITVPPGTTAPISRPITISSNSGVVSFSATTFSSAYQPWLSVSPYYGTVSPGAPATVIVTVQPALLPAGPSIGVIDLKRSDSSVALTIPVNVNSPRDSSINIAPAQVSLTAPAGAASPLTQTLTLTAVAAANYTVQASTFTGPKWLAVSPGRVSTTAGGAPSTLTVQVNTGGLSTGAYQGEIIVTNTASGAQRTIPVMLTVAPPASLSAQPAALTFNYQTGASIASLAQAVQVTSTGSTTAFTATTAGINGSPNFLAVDSSNSTTPGTVSIGLDPSTISALPIGAYFGIVTISSPGNAGVNQTVNVTLNVSPRVTSIVNSASIAAGPVSPGEMVTIFGSGFGAGVAVTFDGYAAPLTYIGADQINAIVPYEIAGAAATSLVISRNGAPSTPLPLQVVETAPAIFAVQNGNGQAAILNADNAYNSPANPAAPGSVIQIFATGEGVTPGAATGSITPAVPPFPSPAAPVSLTIGGQPAQLLYAGEAPGLLSGLLQIDAVVPLDARSGPQQIVLTTGANSNKSQQVTVAIR